MDEFVRHDYVLALDGELPVAAVPAELTVRVLHTVDDDSLAVLMEAAYAGTIDEQLGGNADGAVEIANWRQFVADAPASRVAADGDGRLVGACLVGRWDGSVFVAYVVTDPAWKGRGVGAAVLAASLGALRDAAEEVVGATITEGNEASERLFAAFGFRRAEAP